MIKIAKTQQEKKISEAKSLDFKSLSSGEKQPKTSNGGGIGHCFAKILNQSEDPFKCILCY